MVFHSLPTRRTPVSIGRVNSPRAVSGLPPRKARIRLSVASRSCAGMTRIPAFVANVAMRESTVPRCPCENSACSGEPNWAIEAPFGRCASAVSARQLLNVSLRPMAALPLILSSPATQSTRLSKTFHRPARMPFDSRTLAISGPATFMSNQCMALPASTASTALGVDVTRALELVGFEVEAIDGEIGKVDEATHEVGSSYVIVDTSPWLFGKRVIPAGVIRRVELGSQRIHVDRAKQ